MQVGVVSDVHANLVALDAVLDAMPAVDALVCAGDVVGYNPWPAECVDRVREREVPTVVGNHDRLVAAGENFGANAMARAGVDYARRTLTDDQLAWLGALPRERRLFDGRVRVVHDHPDRVDHYTYPEEFSPALLDGEAVLVLGHTHVQAHRVFEEGVVLNPGSVGQPRDGDPRAAFAVVDLETREVTAHRVPYDVAAVREAVAAAGLPAETGERLETGR